ncbi:MAG: preprotein translocase subunit SecE [Oscillospiraceae bacterium]|nr:preprotein translocase subunit SecE [Oscillospiraceae bacterium]
MAEEKTNQKAPAAKETTKKKKKAKGSGRIGKWFREMRSELKKIVWPTKKQVWNNCLVAVVVIVLFSIVIWGFDQFAVAVVHMLQTLGG